MVAGTALDAASRRTGTARVLLWLAALVCVYAVARAEPRHLLAASGAVVGAGGALLVSRYPLKASLLLVTALPFELYGSAALYRIGVPAGLLRAVRFWPEVVIAGLAVAALARSRRRGRARLDGADLAALAFICIGTIYLLVPQPFVSAPIGAHLGLYARALGWRSDVMYVALFLLARRLHLGAPAARRVLNRIVAVGTVVAALGLFEFAAPGVWDRVAAGTLQVPGYQLHVLDALPVGSGLGSVEVFGTLGGRHLVRVGSVLDYESLGFYLVICLAGVAELWARGRQARWMPAAFVVLALGLFVTQTRSGILAGAIAVGLALRPGAGRRQVQLRRVAAGLAAAAILGGGLYLFGHVGSRLAGDRTSDSAHAVEVHQGFQALWRYPLGRGLATAGPQYKRSALNAAGLSTYYAGPATGIAVTDDQWLAVGTEMGVLGLAAYAAMCVLVLRRLGRSSTEAGPDGGEVAGAAGNALVGVLIGGTLLQPFISPAVSVTLFALAGLGSAPALAAPAWRRDGSTSVLPR